MNKRFYFVVKGSVGLAENSDVMLGTAREDFEKVISQGTLWHKDRQFDNPQKARYPYSAVCLAPTTIARIEEPLYREISLRIQQIKVHKFRLFLNQRIYRDEKHTLEENCYAIYQKRDYARGEVVLQQGELTDLIFLIYRGSVQVRSQPA